MFKRIARLFTIKTRTEAYLVTYAIAVGAVERGIHFMQMYPGNIGLFMALACTGVPFIAGAKLLDSVRPRPQVALRPRSVPLPRRRTISYTRPRSRPMGSAARSRRSLRTD